MNKRTKPNPVPPPNSLSHRVGATAKRKLAAQQQLKKTIWFGFGWFGLIGWSVAVPTLLGVFAGLWLDRHYPGRHSFTLMLLVAGLVLGCWNAWNWVADEDMRMHDKPDDRDE